ncbi:CHAD domain-containing protein [Nocardioides guangzhouensis]|uniref:CHAD domain-containing protein n=1 Tax=Nocardioides guangzhouensis TaxID=2497878 RepID=A0A4Q4ZJW0_9ACTN|nr:CHAD domain-containing protein [Nocardioides guangzhouensis]RYP88642.1 CHAD domain-containing protein [Nocardioides guangzhouensis]
MARTIEMRYDATAGLPALEGLPGSTGTVDGAVDEWDTVYFDTVSLELTAAGVVLCRREGGGEPGWFLTVPMSGEDLDVRVPLARSTHTAPRELRGAVTAFAGNRVLQPVCRVRTVRRSRQVVGGVERRVLTEVVDDDVVAEVLVDGHESARWREWTVRPGDADDELLAALARQLGEAGAGPATGAHGLAVILGTPPVVRREPGRRRVRRGSPTSELVQGQLVGLVAQVPERDVAVRRDLPGAVHQLRVTFRRIRSLLASFESVLDAEDVDALRSELKWVNDLLGEVRDAEVVLARLLTRLDEQPGEVRSPMAVRVVHQSMRRRHDEAQRFVLAAMESPRYVEMLERLAEVADAPPWRKRARKRVRDVVPDLLRDDVARLGKRMTRLPASGDPDFAHRLHQARKAAKRVRYTAEACRPVYGKHARRLARSMKQFQQHLGEHHDAAMTSEVVREEAAAPGTDGRVAFALGRVDLVEEQAGLRIASEVPRAWTRHRPRKLSGWAR